MTDIQPWRGRNQTGSITRHDRFWEKVLLGEKDECWEWQAGTSSTGYGSFYMGDGIREPSNRAAWILIYGSIPKGMYVCHTCDNPKCCNPDHLFLGTVQDNNRDRHEKGRDADLSGEKHPGAKLTREDVREIRRLYDTGEYRQVDLASKFPVGRSQIANIVCGLEWNHG